MKEDSIKIHYVVSAFNQRIFNKCIKPCLTHKKSVEIVHNTPLQNSMTKKYNTGVRRIKDLKDNDIIVFIHEDAIIKSKTFEQDLKDAFIADEKVGVVGVFGSSEYEGTGWWLSNPYTHCGKIIQGRSSMTNPIFSIMERNSAKLKSDMVVVDGCMMAVKGKLAKIQEWDETVPGYHFYDNKYCLDVLMNTDYKVAVADALIAHLSEGGLSKSWHDSAAHMKEYINKLGYSLPLTVKQINNKKETLNGLIS